MSTISKQQKYWYRFPQMHVLLSAVASAASLSDHDIGRSFGSVLGTKKIHIYRILELKKAQEIILKKKKKTFSY